MLLHLKDDKYTSHNARVRTFYDTITYSWPLVKLTESVEQNV